MSTSRIISKVVLFSLVLALCLTVGWAGSLQEGSTSVAGRTLTDTALGQVMIFNGDFFLNAGETVTTFSFFNGNGSAGKFVTPILFTEGAGPNGVFTVVAIGTTDTTVAGLNTFLFNSVNGSPVISGPNFTFGFIEAAVDTNGNQTTSSTGGVDLNNPLDGGTDVTGDGGSTNDWVFTPTPGSGGVNIHIGTTFNIPTGSNAGTFALNRSTLGGFSQDRTYSANLNSAASGVPEPGTLTLFTSGAGLLLAGLLRFRRRRS